jgi:hypothetical protein
MSSAGISRELPASSRRIALLCAGLEDGRNGVGDYCRQLTRALTRRQVRCDLMALNDREITEVTRQQLAFGDTMSSLVRIPARLRSAERFRIAEQFLRGWQPHWVSLQFVSYGFQEKGIALREASWLPRLLRPYHLEIMMHELWIGFRPEDPIKNRVIGRIQRFAILRMIERAKPEIIHTSNEVFRELLARARVTARPLPLFGNIPVSIDTAPWLVEAIKLAFDLDIKRDREKVRIFGFFGGIPHAHRCEPLLDRIQDIAVRAGFSALVASVGHAGPQIPQQFADWQARYPALRFMTLGPQSPSAVSQFLNTIDFGLTSYPFYMLGKSGAAAAMLEHGVPVIAAWGADSPAASPVYPPFVDLVWANDDRLEARLRAPRPHAQRTPDMAARVADTLLSDLFGISTLR